MHNEAVASALLDIGAVGFQPDSPITFKSGIISPVYVDNRRLPYHPAQWRVVIEAFADSIKSNRLSPDVIAGVAVGGIPHSSALAYVLSSPSVFVRKEAKSHGKQQLVEGGEVKNKDVLLVEDLVTTGGSSLAAVDALRAEGATVSCLVAIVEYGFSETHQRFNASGVTLLTLTNFDTIINVATERRILTHEQVAIVKDWFADPYGWPSRRKEH